MADIPELGDVGKNSKRNKWLRAIANLVGGAVPVVGGVLSAGASMWGEAEQERVTEALQAFLKMLEDELREKQRTIVEILARIDMHDEEIASRVKSDEYQRLLKKAFRNWAGTESQTKQEYIRNILSNAATVTIVSDDVVSLFIEWLQQYSEFHFAIIGQVYRAPGSTRADIWDDLGKGSVREDSAEADLFKLLIRDLSTGGIIRQHRETDHAGNFYAKSRTHSRRRTAVRTVKSAFDDIEMYELTALGQQFVHYAMTDLPIKIAYHAQAFDEDETSDSRPVEVSDAVSA
jgi:hypothetical protein